MVDDDSGLSGGGLLAAAEVVEVVMLLMMTEPERDIGKVVFVGAVIANERWRRAKTNIK